MNNLHKITPRTDLERAAEFYRRKYNQVEIRIVNNVLQIFQKDRTWKDASTNDIYLLMARWKESLNEKPT